MQQEIMKNCHTVECADYVYELLVIIYKKYMTAKRDTDLHASVCHRR